MDYSALLSIIENDPNLLSMAMSGDHTSVADALNALTLEVMGAYQLTTTDVLDVLGPIRGTEVITALRSVPEFVELMKLMDDRFVGININHPESSAIFTLLVTAGIITEVERDTILDLRKTTTSIALDAFKIDVHHLDVAKAMELMQ